MDGLSLADIAAVSKGNNGGFMNGDWGGMFGLLVLLGIMNGGLGGWGGAGRPGFGGPQLATSNEVQQGFANLNNQDAFRDLTGAVTTAGTNGIAATKEAQYETINVMKDAQVALTRELGIIESQGESALAKLNECCCQILRGQDAIKYDALQNRDVLSQRMNDMENRITGLITQNKIEAMQQEIASLRLNQALCGVVRYPTTAAYDAGAWPFGGGAARVSTATTTGT